MPDKKLLSGLLLLVGVFLGCGPEKETENFAQEIIGHWDVTQATRNKKPTTSLEDAYFEFQADNNAILNLNGGEEPATFELDGKVIKVKGSALEGDFQILKLIDNKMILSTTKKLNGLDFSFVFHMTRQDSTEAEVRVDSISST